MVLLTDNPGTQFWIVINYCKTGNINYTCIQFAWRSHCEHKTQVALSTVWEEISKQYVITVHQPLMHCLCKTHYFLCCPILFCTIFGILCKIFRPVARIFRRGVTWHVMCVYMHYRWSLIGSGACSPRKFLEIRYSEIASETILGLKQSHSNSISMARGV